MKKFTSPLSFFLSLFLLAGLVSPAALADGRLDRERLKACAARLIALAYQSNCYEDPVSYSEQFQN